MKKFNVSAACKSLMRNVINLLNGKNYEKINVNTEVVNEFKKLLLCRIEEYGNSEKEEDKLTSIGLEVINDHFFNDILDFHYRRFPNPASFKKAYRYIHEIFARKLYRVVRNSSERKENYREFLLSQIKDSELTVQRLVVKTISFARDVIDLAALNVDKSKRVYDPYLNVVISFVTKYFQEVEDVEDCEEYVKDWCYRLMRREHEDYQKAIEGDENSICKLASKLISLWIYCNMIDGFDTPSYFYPAVKEVKVLLNTDKFLQENPEIRDNALNGVFSYEKYFATMKNRN